VIVSYPSAKGAVTIPARVTSIGDRAFIGCTSLPSVTIPSSVKSIGEWSFAGCTSLTSIIISFGVTFIGNSAFLLSPNLASITIPSSVTSIGYGAFSYWISSQTINIEGHTNQASADRVWGEDWRYGCDARINYRG